MTMSSYRHSTIYAGISPQKGEIDSNPVIIDFTDIFNAGAPDGTINAISVAGVWSAMCGHGSSDEKMKKLVDDKIKSALREGYFTVKDHESYVFFLAHNGSIYSHNYSSGIHCRSSDIEGLATGIGYSSPSPGEVLYAVISKIFSDWYVKGLKKGHYERVKDRVININKRG